MGAQEVVFPLDCPVGCIGARVFERLEFGSGGLHRREDLSPPQYGFSSLYRLAFVRVHPVVEVSHGVVERDIVYANIFVEFFHDTLFCVAWRGTMVRGMVNLYDLHAKCVAELGDAPQIRGVVVLLRTTIRRNDSRSQLGGHREEPFEMNTQRLDSSLCLVLLSSSREGEKSRFCIFRFENPPMGVFRGVLLPRGGSTPTAFQL